MDLLRPVYLTSLMNVDHRTEAVETRDRDRLVARVGAGVIAADSDNRTSSTRTCVASTTAWCDSNHDRIADSHTPSAEIRIGAIDPDDQCSLTSRLTDIVHASSRDRIATSSRRLAGLGDRNRSHESVGPGDRDHTASSSNIRVLSPVV